MPLFISIITTFPTVIFTVLLCVAVVYWLLSLSGLADSDVIEGDVGDGSSLALGGLLATLGLHGVPLPLVITLVALTGWLFSYFATLLLGTYLNPGLLLWLFNGVVLVLGFVVATIITSLLIRPLRPLFRPAQHLPIEQRLTGKQCTVRSAEVNKEKGRADAHIDGDHLILQVRSDSALVRGERAIIIQYLVNEDAYWVVSEKDFEAGLAD
ncbi:hypothetical protein QT231_22505 [Halomonas sp. SpR1]|uniref:hypothetical protein n=1 Tax=Halomonas sp. SpR1 TaxID=3050462 RepID=UPI0027E493AE|nr:hypothetical protein [Halomonas sp. SpR1]MDQ7735483.1 hypothetical protein [Halomonas sp. SpR1]